MTDSNRRAAVLTVALVAALVGAPAVGTLAGPVAATHAGSNAQQTTTTAQQTTTPGTPDHAVSPRELPERPDPLNASNVDQYVAAYEEARKHNEILRETTDATVTSISVGCGPASLDAQDDGFVVEVSCGFSYEFGENGTPTGVADGLPYVARYFVNETTTQLVSLRSALGVGAALPLPVPEKPDPLNESSVLRYAAAYEEVRKHNEILDEANAPNATVTQTFVSCLPELVEETDDGFRVDVACTFAYFLEQDGSVVIVESLLVPSYTAQYHINETATELLAVEQARGGNQTTATTVEAETTAEA